VQASLRTIALWMGSPSSSDTNVMRTPAAWAHDTSAMRETANFITSDCNGNSDCTGSTSRAASEGGKLHFTAFIFGVELTSEQGDRRDQVHPHQECDSGADRAIHDVVAGDV